MGAAADWAGQDERAGAPFSNALRENGDVRKLTMMKDE